MKIKTSVTLSEKLLAAIDEVAGPGLQPLGGVGTGRHRMGSAQPPRRS